jgi:hypothetical protein
LRGARVDRPGLGQALHTISEDLRITVDDSQANGICQLTVEWAFSTRPSGHQCHKVRNIYAGGAIHMLLQSIVPIKSVKR